MPGGPNSLFIGRHFSVARLRVEPQGGARTESDCR